MEQRLDDPSIVAPITASDYDAARAAFQWPRSERFNIGHAICSWWAERAPERVAIRYVRDPGDVEDWSYGRLEQSACRLANALAALGLERGQRCAVLLGQRPETAIAHVAIYKLGALALPLFVRFGEEALTPRLRDAGAGIVITDAENLPKLAAIRAELPALRHALCIDGPGDGADGFWQTLERASDQHRAVETGPDDPAFISYTSGTTGPPKGALHAHRVVIGHLPSVQMWLEGFPREDDVVWTPADWAWMGGLTNIMMPSLLYGAPLVAHRAPKFDPEQALAMMARLGVTVGFLPPTALKILRSGGDPARHRLRLRAAGSGGEPLGAELLAWGRESLGVAINEFYGQTECNLVVSNCGAMMPAKPNSMGRASLGAEVAVIDSEGRPLADGEEGEIAVRRPHPAMFLAYWNNPPATADKFAGDWMRTGDEGWRDEAGYFFFKARADDVINSAGYRIGPSEVEECLAGHPAVSMAGVIGAPDPVRGEAVVAFVVTRDGRPGDPELAAELARHVRARLGGHEYPRDVHFVDALPMTATGKIMRRELKRRLAAQSAP